VQGLLTSIVQGEAQGEAVKLPPEPSQVTPVEVTQSAPSALKRELLLGYRGYRTGVGERHAVVLGSSLAWGSLRLSARANLAPWWQEVRATLDDDDLQLRLRENGVALAAGYRVQLGHSDVWVHSDAALGAGLLQRHTAGAPTLTRSTEDKYLVLPYGELTAQLLSPAITRLALRANLQLGLRMLFNRPDWLVQDANRASVQPQLELWQPFAGAALELELP
jgi:hypothetical protein